MRGACFVLLACCGCSSGFVVSVPNHGVRVKTALSVASLPKIEEQLREEAVPSPFELAHGAAQHYARQFGREEHDGQFAAAFAPGRVNLIGEHTDYNGGFVMPLALEHGTAIFGTGGLLQKVEGRQQKPCIVASNRMRGDVEFTADKNLAPGDPSWANLIKGVVAQYLPDVPEGRALWFNAFYSGTVPVGGGVSSSASLSVATATFIEELLAKEGVAPPTPTQKAVRCQLAEHEFADTPCGIMDQFISAMARPGHAMLLDCRTNEPTAVPLADPALCILVTNSNVVHSLGERGSQYPVRVRQCAAAVSAISRRYPEVSQLRDATLEQLEASRADMDDVVFRRARHVISENARCLETAEALQAKDYKKVGRHMVESHRSLAEDYEVSTGELDALVRIAVGVDGVYGSRLTGAGFGGCVVTLVRKESVPRLVRQLQERYHEETGLECKSFVTQPGRGAHALDAERLAAAAAAA